MNPILRALNQTYRSCLTAIHTHFSSTPTHNGQGQKSTPSPISDNAAKPINLSDIAQKAIWAAKIINIIKDAKPPTSVKDSLRDQIIDMTNETIPSQFKMDPSIKQQMLSMFTTGTKVDISIFNQLRFTQALVNQKLTFFPTYSVTKGIFLKLLSGKSYVVSGKSGSGKSFSIMLFIQLAWFINTLRYKSVTDQQFRSQEILLQKHKLIMDVPKCWYWSVHQDLNEETYKLKEKVMNQLSEVGFSKEQIETLKLCKTLLELSIQISLFHPNNIRRMIIIDQVNVIISCIRDWNSSLQLYHHKIRIMKDTQQALQSIKQELYTKRVEYQIPAERLRKLAQQFKQLGQSYLLNSSTQLEESQLVRSSQQVDKPINLSFYHHDARPDIQPVDFRLTVKQNHKKIQFFQFMLFMLSQNQQKTASQQIFKHLKQSYNIEKFEMKAYHQFLFIRQYFSSNNYGSFIQKKEIDMETDRSVLVVDFLNDFYLSCLERCRQKLDQFIKKGQSDRIKAFRLRLVIALNIYAQSCIKEGKEKLIIQSDQILNILNQDQKEQNRYTRKDLEGILVSAIHNKQLLPCTILQQSHQILFDWSPAQFFQISLYPILNRKQNSQNKDSTQYAGYLKTMIQQNPLFRGSGLQGIIRQAIKASKSVIFRTHKTQTTPSRQLFFQIAGSTTFKSFNANFTMNKKQGPSIQHNLHQILKLAHINPNFSFIGTPIIIKKQNLTQSFSSNSQSFDFIIVAYDSAAKKYLITTFDVTIDKKKKQIQDKAENAIQLLKQVLKQQKYPSKYQFKHVVVCRSEFFMETINVNSRLSVLFCNYQDILFRDCKDYDVLNGYRQFVTISKKIP